MTVEELIRQNDIKRQHPEYDPYTGEGAPLERKWLEIEDFYLPRQYVPIQMLENSIIKIIQRKGSIKAFLESIGEEYTKESRKSVVKMLIEIRNEHDFFYWAASFGTIKNKMGGGNIPFILNRAQRRLIEKYERMRLEGKPIRLILLKARQWGGSTATQIYMAWIQLVHKQGWYSAIVAQDNSSSIRIKEMYSKLLAEYPPELLGLPEEIPLEFGSYGGSNNDYIIKQRGEVARDTVVSIGSVISPNSIRSGDIAMMHASEVGVWKETEQWNASSIIRSVTGSILDEEMTMIVLESTANGTGNYFHTEWLRANKPDGDKEKSNMTPLFVAWYEIEMYSKDFESEEQKNEFAEWLLYVKNDDTPFNAPDAGQYYWWLWNKGATLENINWYVEKRRTYGSHADMAAEFPSDDVEAFKHSGQKIFDIYKLEELRKMCCDPTYIGELSAEDITGADSLRNIHFTQDEKGKLHIWEMPDKEQKVTDRYLVILDPNKGRSKTADNGDILVLDRYWRMYGGNDEVVAEWNGVVDKDLLAWKAAQIAKFYNNALLVIEKNTFDQEKGKQMDDSAFIIDLIHDEYDNLYVNKDLAKVKDGQRVNYGFHTNGSSKPAIIENLTMQVRELSYTERSVKAVDEMAVYEKKDDGNWGAVQGANDDRVMTRAIGLFVSKKMDVPVLNRNIKFKAKNIKKVTT